MQICVSDIATAILALDAENSALKQEISGMVNVQKFYAVALSTEEVARLHGVATATVRDYAKRGLIELHPKSTDAKILIRASEALLLDFAELKKQKSYQKYMM